MTTLRTVLCKNYDCRSMMLMQSCYEAAMVKLRSVITPTYSSVIMNLTVIYVATYIYTSIDLRNSWQKLWWLD